MSWVVKVAAIAFVMAITVSAVQSQSDESATGTPPSPRQVPGLNAPDPFPNGCVDCHINMKERNLDTRFSTLMAKWADGVEPRLLAAAKAAAADSTKIKGKHLKLSVAKMEIPDGCLKCHGSSSTAAPPFARLMHLVHLTGGDANPYMEHFNGDCTPCHKLNKQTGTWSVASAKEPAGE